MFNPDQLTAALAPLLPFRQSPTGHADAPQLAAELLAPAAERATAVCVQDLHPLLTTANLRLTAPEMPAEGPDRGAQLSAWLAQQRRASVRKLLDAFAARQKLGGAKTILQEQPLTQQSGAYRDKVIKQGRFVGLAFRLRENVQDVALRITGLGTQFTEPEPDFRLFLYHSSSTEPVANYPAPRTSRTYFEWTLLRIELPGEYVGGEWCLGYFEDELRGQAVRLDTDFARRPCQSCGSDWRVWEQWNPLVQVRSFSVEASYAEPGMWNGIVNYHADTNWGLNLKLSAECDLTAYLSARAAQLLLALRTQLAVDLLSQLANTTRLNGPSAATQKLALVELNNRPNTPGLVARLETEIAALSIDLSGVSRPCLPAAPAAGVQMRWGTVR